VTLLGFAIRTGRFVAGETGARVVARRRGRGVLLVASDLDPRRVARIQNWADECGVPLFRPLTGDEMSAAAGRSRCDVLLVHDRDLAKALGNALGAHE